MADSLRGFVVLLQNLKLRDFQSLRVELTWALDCFKVGTCDHCLIMTHSVNY